MNPTRKKSTPILLMGTGLVLLIILQMLWLQTEYKGALNTFGRETSFTLRSTLHQLSDSLFFGSLQNLVNDSLADAGKPGWEGSIRDKVREISFTHINVADTLPEQNKDSDDNEIKKISISIANPAQPADSFIITRQSNKRQDFRWLFSEEIALSNDSILEFYKRNLNPAYTGISMHLLEKEFDMNSDRPSNRSMRDSLPFTTGYYPFAQKLYAIEFQQGQYLVLKKLLPQAGFALFTSALIIISFLMIYRNLRSQQRLMELKDNFISNVTHELKTPVASVGVAIEAIRNFDVLKDKEKTIEYLTMAGSELDRLGLLVEKILKTSVLDYNDEIKQNKTLLNAADMAEKVMASFSVAAKEKQIGLVLEKSGNLELWGNEEHLTQAVYNLVDNAFKYAQDGKFIKITLGEIPDHVIIEIEDKGVGISAEHKDRVFEKFYRIPTGNLHNIKGYGLGLHYVAEVIHQHEGKISLESSPGKGCKFTIRLKKNL